MTTAHVMLSLLCLASLAHAAPQQPNASQPRDATAPAAIPDTITLSGRVVDLRGEGVPVARVWVVDPDGDSDGALARTTADAEGYFRIARVPPQSLWTVRATADGRSTSQTYARSAGSVLQIELHDATTVRGVVLDSAGGPVAGVTVGAAPAGRALSRRQLDAVTDDEGRFVIEGAPLGLSHLSAWVPGEGVAQLRHRVRGDDDVTLRAEKTAKTSFHFTFEGLPAKDRPKVRLAWLPYRDGSLTYLPDPYRDPVVDGDEWRADGLPDWRYVVRPRATGYTFQPNEVTLEAGGGPHQVGFVATKLGSEQLHVPAVVRGADGAPVAGVEFVLRRFNGGERATATSDERGQLTFVSPLAAGTKVIVYATDAAWTVDQTKVDGMYGTWDRRFLEDHECTVDPTSTLQLRVVPACSAEGRLLLPDGRPAAFTRVQLEEHDANRTPAWMSFASTVTGRDGRYRITGRHHSANPVRVYVEGTAGNGASEPFAIDAPGTAAKVPDLTLSPPAVVEGVVADADGAPAPGVTVWLRDWDFTRGGQKSGSVTEVITDRQGRYRFVGVPIGGAWLQVVDDETERRRQKVVEPFEVEPGETYRHDLKDPFGG